MELQNVKLIYRHVIAANAANELERTIWQVTYNEFKLRCQAYNPDNRFELFSEMVAANGKANSLHYKIGFPATPFISQFKNIIPGETGTLGEPIPFEFAETTLLESGVKNEMQHVIALTYTTRALSLVRSFGDVLLLAPANIDQQQVANASPYFMVRLKEGMGMDWLDGLTNTGSISG